MESAYETQPLATYNFPTDWVTPDVQMWYTRMLDDAYYLQPDGLGRFLARYSRENGCPFDAVIYSGEGDAIMVTTRNFLEATTPDVMMSQTPFSQSNLMGCGHSANKRKRTETHADMQPILRRVKTQ
jgi:hypothetical protein